MSLIQYNKLPVNIHYVCSKCGTEEVGGRPFIFINGGFPETWNDDKINDNYFFCCNCEDEVEIITIQDLWNELSDVCIDENENIETDFHWWPAGTPRSEIWHWFDERCPHSLAEDLMYK